MTLRLKANRRFPSIPVVTDNPQNHTGVLMAVKEALDIGQRRTGDLLNSFIRVEDLIDLGLITIEGNTNAIVGADLSEIADIGDLSGAAAADFLRFDGSEWINDNLHNTDITQVMVTQHEAALSIAWSQLTGTPPSLDDLFDVDAPAPADGDVLTWNDASSEWIAAAPTGGGGSVQYLDDLLDVDAPYPSAGDFLQWDGYAWVPEAIPESTGTIIYADASVPSGNTVANTTTETVFTSANDIALTLLQEGFVHRGQLHGTYHTDASAGTLRIRIKLGGTTILDTTAFTATNSIVNLGWKLEWTFVVLAEGAVGSVEVQGLATFSSGVTSAQVIHLQNTSPITVDISGGLTPLTVTAQWGTADTDNSITLREMILFAEGVDFIAPDFTKALLHFEGTDGSTTITDQYGHTWTAQSAAQIDTSQFIAGASSLQLVRASVDYVDSTDADYTFGTGDFTIECWARWESDLTGNRAVFSWGQTNWSLYTFGGQLAVFDSVASNAIVGGLISLDTWYHLALTRQGTSLRLFLDGVQQGSTASNSTDFSSPGVRFGHFFTGTASFNGHIDEARVSVGLARYTANFTPPTPPFPDP